MDATARVVPVPSATNLQTCRMLAGAWMPRGARLAVMPLLAVVEGASEDLVRAICREICKKLPYYTYGLDCVPSDAAPTGTIGPSAGETRHFHAWFRAGRVFTMQGRVFSDRTACHKWAAKQCPAKEDRLVLACTKCPVSRKSRRRAIRWGHVARELGVTLPALRAAIETEQRRE